MKNMKKISCLLMSVIMIIMMIPASVFGATVYFTVTENNQIKKDANGELLVQVPVEADNFDLKDYGLEEYNLSEGTNPSILQATIKFLEKYENNSEKLQIPSELFAIKEASKPGGIWYDKFMGNPGYCLFTQNWEPPYIDKENNLMATADVAVLQDGDHVSYELLDPNDKDAFNSNADAKFDKSSAEVKTGEELNLVLNAKVYGEEFTAIKDADIVYTADGGETWFSARKTDKDGKLVIKFRNPGEYILVNKNLGSYAKNFSAATCKVNVTGDHIIPQGWDKLGSEWQYFDNGVERIGWMKTAKGNWFYFDENGIMETGWMKTAKGNWFYFGENGIMKTGWMKTSKGNWFYFGKSGIMRSNGWLKLNGKWNHFDKAGKWIA